MANPNPSYSLKRRKELEKWCKEFYNPLVKDFFDEIDEANWNGVNPNYTKTEAREFFTIDPLKDSMIAVEQRINLFSQYHLNVQIPDIGNETSNSGFRFKGKPKVTLVFFENWSPEKSKPVHGIISFRINLREGDTFSMSEAKTLGQRIKTKFANNYVWHKGKNMYSYNEWERGYKFQVLSQSVTSAKDLISDVMSLQNHTPNWSYLNENKNYEPSEAYPTNPGTEIILGRTVKLPARRPLASVKFRYAVLTISGIKTVLYDDTGRLRNALVT